MEIDRQTGEQFEKCVARIFADNGFWALNIPKNKGGAQPFDIIAIRDDEVWAVDCKICSAPRLPKNRVEDNQWLAFEVMNHRTFAICGFVCLYDGEIYFVDVDEMKVPAPSVKLHRRWVDIIDRS